MGLHLAPTRLPRAASGDPERQRNQLQVEANACALQVQAVEAELARARKIARRVDLREAGEARADAMARLVAGNLRQRDQSAVAADFDLAGHQRARSDEAHVADQDVPQ